MQRSSRQIMDDVKAQHAREDAQKPALGPAPPPEVLAMPIPLEDPRVPRNARAVAKLGSAYKITYSRGPRSTQGGWEMVDCVTVRVIAGKRRLVAVWQGGEFWTAYADRVGKVNFTKAKKYLTQDLDIEWLPGYAWLPRN